jgi:hypothetical protein
MKLPSGISRSALVLSILALNAGLLAQTPAKPGPKKKPAAKTAPAPAAAKAPEPPPPPPPTDVRLHTQITTGAQGSENTTLIRGPWQRVEFPGMTVISQCDLGRTVQINDQSKHYIVQKHQSAEPAAGSAPATASAGDAFQQAMQGQQAMMQQQMEMQKQAMGGHKPQAPKGGVVTYTTTLTDTGETKEFFGRQARRVKTVTVGESSETACQKVKSRIEVDAWYLDVPPSMAGCTPKLEVKPQPAAASEACTDRLETKTIGDAKLGFPVTSTTVSTTGEAAEATSTTVKVEVDKMEITRLDAALFDVPEGYTEVASYSELVPSMASGGSLADALLGSVKNGTRSVRPKDAGTVRIGVPEPANKSQRDLSGRQLQDELVSNFSKAPYEAVPIFGSTPEELQKDAQAKECDHVLVATVTEAKTSHPSKAGGMLKMVSGDGPPNDTHEIKLDYKLFDVNAPDKVEASNSTKTSSGGGFGLKSAMHLAMFAGQMYMGFGMNRLMMGQMGGALGASALMGGGMTGMVNPTMGAMNMVMSGASQMAMSSMMGGANGAGGDMAQMQSDQAFRQTMSKALDGVSDSVTATLGKTGTVAKK